MLWIIPIGLVFWLQFQSNVDYMRSTEFADVYISVMHSSDAAHQYLATRHGTIIRLKPLAIGLSDCKQYFTIR